MNMKKITLISVALLLATASAFAWSKRNQNDGNLGRMYVSAGGGVNMSKYKVSGIKKETTGAHGEVVVNAPVFKPGVNAFRDIKWAGLDINGFFNFDYAGKIDSLEFRVGPDSHKYGDITNNKYSVGVGLTPYLNLKTDLPFLKAIKPFGIAYCGYEWSSTSYDYNGDGVSRDNNYFIYGVGGGVEFVIVDQLTFTPTWQWRGNSDSNEPCYQVVTAELSYWFTGQFAVSAFWTHNFGVDRYFENGDRISLTHGDIIGLKFKLGFTR